MGMGEERGDSASAAATELDPPQYNCKAPCLIFNGKYLHIYLENI